MSPDRADIIVAGVAITLAQTRWQKQFMTPAVHAVIALPTVWRPLTEKLSALTEQVHAATCGRPSST